jgi:hypothetical protein
MRGAGTRLRGDPAGSDVEPDLVGVFAPFLRDFGLSVTAQK